MHARFISWRQTLLERTRLPDRWHNWPPELALVLLMTAAVGWGVQHFLGPAIPDPVIYANYAQSFWHGAPPLSAMPTEYPPFALTVFTLALGPGMLGPTVTFILWMGVCFMLGYFLIVRWYGRRCALAYAVYLFGGVGAFVLARFDLVPALLCVAALHLATRRQYLWAQTLLAAGALIKLYPVFLLPVVALAEWQTLAGTGTKLANLRAVLGHLVGGGAIIAAGFLLAWLRNPTGAFSALTTATGRSTQVESTWSSFVWLSTWFGQSATVSFSSGSHNWTGPFSAHLAALGTPAVALGCLVVYGRIARGGMSLAAAFLATLCMVVLGNKVFSTQYLIWMLPFVAIAVGFDVIWVLICLLTDAETILYPFNTSFTIAEMQHFMVVVTLRNLLLIIATVWLLARPQDNHQPASQAHPTVAINTIADSRSGAVG